MSTNNDDTLKWARTAPRRVFSLPEAEWEAFCELLDKEAKPCAALQELFARPLPWSNDAPTTSTSDDSGP